MMIVREGQPEGVNALFSSLDDTTMADLVQRLMAARDTSDMIMRAAIAAKVADDILKRVSLIRDAKRVKEQP